MLKFDRQQLIPAVIQDDATGDVLMVAFMNEEAFQRTRETGYTHFFSRSRQAIWRKGEQSGNEQEVRAMFVNCEENSLLIRVVQHGDAACHTGHRSCYYRRLLPDGTYETIAERVFDPAVVYNHVGAQFIAPQFIAPSTTNENAGTDVIAPLENKMRQLYNAYLYLHDHDLSEVSNTSRLLLEHNESYLTARLADELQELTEVQSGEHVHAGQQPDTILEGSQVAYWLMLLAATGNLRYDDFTPHLSIIQGYTEGLATKHISTIEKAIEQQQNCLNLLAANDHALMIQGFHIGFTLIGWACAQADVDPLAPAEYDIEQMRRKGLIQP
ncbi:MAG TPA: phosphoribosyl-AMP cyclohydrolase [Ktedonobacteraceae bacterium]|nr:phosphoribosyl-AMP cyclohydrolase [Ktedonobacteraceae bacterium]